MISPTSFQLTSVPILLQWFGEGEKYVKAVFSLASKIAPSVVFVDEVCSAYDSFRPCLDHDLWI